MSTAKSFLILLLCSCNGGTVVPDDTSDTDVDTDIDTADTGPVGTDNDGDGWTVEGGDCDDSDIYVNPAWSENTTDDKDNDCDGRIDEVLAGIIVVDSHNSAAEPIRLHTFNLLGDLIDTQNTSFMGIANKLEEAIDHDGWAIMSGPTKQLFHLDAQDNESIVWDNNDLENPEDPPPYGLYNAFLAHQDGYYLLGALDRLYNTDEYVALDTGDTDTDSSAFSGYVDQWNCLEEDMEANPNDVCLWDLSYDWITEEILIFGYFGAVAKWSPDSGIEVLLEVDPLDFDLQIKSSTYKPFQGHYVIGRDQETNLDGVYIWNPDTVSLDLLGAFPDPLWQVSDIVIDDESGDIFVTSGGGQHYGIYRVSAEGVVDGFLVNTYSGIPDAEPLYPSIYNENHKFTAIDLVWDQD